MPASDRIDELKKRYDENPRRFFASLANEFRKAGDLEQAITICQAHLVEQPSNMNGHVVYGQALFEAGRYDEAKTTFEAALNLDPENLIALRHLGDIACTHGENDSARTWYERVLDADPRNEEIIALLAHLAADPGAVVRGAPGARAPAPDDNEATVKFKPPQVITPPVSTPLSTPVADPTPVVPLDSIKTLQIPVAPPAPAPRKSIGLMDLSIDFEATTETPRAVPVVPADDELGVEFPSFGDMDAAPPPDSPLAPSDAAGDFLIDPFSDSFADPVQAAPAETPEATEGAQPEPPAAPFVTETMAELYLQQGFTAEALDVYRQLSVAFPDDEKLKERVRKLERGDRTSIPLDIIPDDALVDAGARGDGIVHDLMPERAPREEPASVPAASGATARSYFAGLAARRAVQGNRRARTAPRTSSPRTAAPAFATTPSQSLDELFQGNAITPGDEAAALAFAQVAGAVEMGSASVQGKPTAPASGELSLDAVFRESEPRVTASVARQSQTLRFDQFFAAAGDEDDAPAPASGSAPVGEPGSPAELQQFQSWLTQLKKP